MDATSLSPRFITVPSVHQHYHDTINNINTTSIADASQRVPTQPTSSSRSNLAEFRINSNHPIRDPGAGRRESSVHDRHQVTSELAFPLVSHWFPTGFASLRIASHRFPLLPIASHLLKAASHFCHTHRSLIIIIIIIPIIVP